jgi:hypothetical protein
MREPAPQKARTIPVYDRLAKRIVNLIVCRNEGMRDEGGTIQVE